MNAEANTCQKYVVPKLLASGWDSEPHSIPEQRTITDSRLIPVGREGFVRKSPKPVDYLLRFTRDFPLSGQSGGTSVRGRRLNPNDFPNLQILWPDQETQLIKECVSRASAIRAIQDETAAELHAMLPAILDKAFKEEL